MNERPYQIEWSPAARRDLRSIARHIARDSTSAALRLARRIRERVEQLAELPERGRAIPELRAHGLDTEREVIARPYRIIYSIGDDTVRILAVLDGRRDLDDLLLERLIRANRPSL